MTTETEQVYVYAMNDCDWVAARSPEEARKGFIEEFCEPDDDYEPRKLTDEEMDTFVYAEDLGDPASPRCSFRDALALRLADGEQPPFFFASTEY